MSGTAYRHLKRAASAAARAVGLRAHGAAYGVVAAFMVLCVLSVVAQIALQLASWEGLSSQRWLELAGAGVGALLAAPATFVVCCTERRRAARVDAQRAEALRTAADDITKRDGAVLLPRAILFAVAQQQQQLLSLRSRSAFSRAAAVAALAFARARMHARFVALPRVHSRAFAFRPGR